MDPLDRRWGRWWWIRAWCVVAAALALVLVVAGWAWHQPWGVAFGVAVLLVAAVKWWLSHREDDAP